MKLKQKYLGKSAPEFNKGILQLGIRLLVENILKLVAQN